MKKRGQLTIFLIVAIIVIAVSALAFFMRGNFGFLNPEAQNVNNFVQDCLQDASDKIVYAAAYGGGYLIPPNLSDELGFPYYYYGGENHMPSKEKMENEMSSNFGKIASLCIRNFQDFKETEITSGEISATPTISEDKVSFEIIYPITIKQGQSSTLLKDFKIEVQVRYGIVYNAVQEFLQEQMTHDGICLNCALDIALKNDLYVDMQESENGTIFSFRDENSKINNETLEFVFINKY
ncbi:hypothetical protein HY449_01780 [Candidatus Pacearchaeota archaeon]|nr:hypothetical protein [Candidatus Pacearchaeota archaeon]